MALDGLKFVIEEDPAPRTKIRVFGVGGGGSNAVARMLEHGLTGVEFCVLNTDAQALESSPCAVEAGDRIQDHQRPGRRIGSGRGPASRARRHRTHHRLAGRRRHGVRHRRPGRRHRHGRGAGGGVARQGTGRVDGGHRHQALRLRGSEAPQAGRSRAWRNWRAWRIPSSPFPTISFWNWRRRAPVSWTRFASPTMFCGKRCRASATSSTRPAWSIAISPTCAAS